MSSRVKEARKRAEYAKSMKEKRDREQLELNAKAMLLGATWEGTHFKRQPTDVGQGDPYLHIEYFNRAGEPITALMALKSLAKPWREL